MIESLRAFTLSDLEPVFVGVLSVRTASVAQLQALTSVHTSLVVKACRPRTQGGWQRTPGCAQVQGSRGRRALCVWQREVMRCESLQGSRDPSHDRQTSSVHAQAQACGIITLHSPRCFNLHTGLCLCHRIQFCFPYTLTQLCPSPGGNIRGCTYKYSVCRKQRRGAHASFFFSASVPTS